MSQPRTGTVTFLFTDIERSTHLWERFPGEMASALAQHDAIVRDAIAAQDGEIFKAGGDSFCVVFSEVPPQLVPPPMLGRGYDG